MDTESDKKSDEMPEFFQEKKEKSLKKEPSKRTFGLKKEQAGTERIAFYTSIRWFIFRYRNHDLKDTRGGTKW